MPETAEEIDPRIRRTRQLLQSALEKLLSRKDFDKISVQDIADAATVNRVTFYDHYPDKFALLQCVVGSRFEELLEQRGVTFDGSCPSAIRSIIRAVCDYLAETSKLGCSRLRILGPHLQSSIISLVQRLLLNGIERHAPVSGAPPEMLATALSWSIYGVAQRWAEMPHRASPDEIVETIAELVAPSLTLGQTSPK